MRFRRVVTPVLAIACAQACESEADLPLATIGAQSTFEGNSTCVAFGDFVPDAFDLVRDDCADAAEGFDDQTVTFQYKTRPVVGAEWESIDSYFLLTYEFRVSDASSFGIRRVEVGPFDASVFEDTSLLVTPGAFDLRLLEELTGAGFIIYVVGCKDPTSAPQLDSCLQLASTDWHYEHAFCIDNAVNITFSDAADLCMPDFRELNHPDTLNTLPTAQFTIQLVDSVPCPTFSFDATPSTDPEQGSLSYSWSFNPATIPSAETPTVTRTFCTSGDYEVRLAVTDTGGGMDIQQSTISVDVPDPPDFVAEIVGPDSVPPNQTCAWTATIPDSEGVPPYAYQWKKKTGLKGLPVEVSTERVYEDDTGASTFTLYLTVWDSANNFDSDSGTVTVTSAVPPFCPSGEL